MKEINLNSFAIAIFLCANPIAWTISFLPNAIVFITLFSWLLLIYNKQFLKFLRVAGYIHWFVLATICVFLISMNVNTTDSLIEYFTFFIICGITGVYFSQLKFSIKKIFQYIAMIAVFLSIFVYNIDFGDPTNESVDYGMWMGVSYGVLRFILALLVVLLLYYKEYKVITQLTFIGAIVIYSLIYSSYASRGALFSIVVFLSCYYLLKETSLIRKKTIVFIGVLFIIFATFRLKEVFLFLITIFDSLNIQVLALDKILLLLEYGDFDNGRNDLIEKGLEGVYHSPFYGNGIAGFENKFGSGYYVHNVFIQILYEGGFILFIPVLIVFLASGYLLLKSSIEKEIKIFITFLFCAGIIELLFSNVYWKSVFFWFYIFYVINILRKINLKKI
ncbi:MAG: hypothetical protein RSF68_04710 [Myroides sp.]